jgi:dTDP-4-dehydrorhamnose 3,5-epimerase
MVNEIYRSDLSRDLMVIPAFGYHAHQNVGTTDALFVSLPSRPYDHESPDVYRFPIDTDQIPYQFIDRKGG